MKAIVFGANGQDGSFLVKLLEEQQLEVTPISRKGVAVQGDVGDYAFVEAQVKQVQPGYIFHLAANSTTRHYALFENHHAISTGTLNMLEAVRLHCPSAKVFLSGSAMQFKNDGLPVSEQTPFEAGSPYAVSRIQSVYAGRYYHKAFGLKVYTGYFFNHDSPLRTEQHVNQKIVKAVQRIAAGSTEKLELGNISVRKEFNYAGDMMKAVWRLVSQDQVYEAVIGSGKAYSIEEWLSYCFEKTGRNWKDHVVLKQDFIPEYQLLVSDPRLLMGLGWQPEVDFYQLADLMLQET